MIIIKKTVLLPSVHLNAWKAILTTLRKTFCPKAKKILLRVGILTKKAKKIRVVFFFKMLSEHVEKNF